MKPNYIVEKGKAWKSVDYHTSTVGIMEEDENHFLQNGNSTDTVILLHNYQQYKCQQFTTYMSQQFTTQHDLTKFVLLNSKQVIHLNCFS